MSWVTRVFNLNANFVYLLLGIMAAWLGVVSFFLIKTISHYNQLTKGTDKTSLSQALNSILKTQNDLKNKIGFLEEEQQRLVKEAKKHLQKFQLLRFNPFEDVGGQQSFVLGILNEENDGIILTSLTSRGGTRWYGKTVKKGKGIEHELSKEEEEIIKKAQ